MQLRQHVILASIYVRDVWGKSSATTGDEEMSLLIPERHGSQYLLMRYASPSDPSGERLATFDSEAAAKAFKIEFAKALAFAREAGISGI